MGPSQLGDGQTDLPRAVSLALRSEGRWARLPKWVGQLAAGIDLAIAAFVTLVSYGLIFVIGWPALILAGATSAILLLGVLALVKRSRLAAVGRLVLVLAAGWPVMAIYGSVILPLWFVASSIALLIRAWKMTYESTR